MALLPKTVIHEKVRADGRNRIGKCLLDDRRVPGVIVLVNRDALRWQGEASIHGSYKTLDDRWKRWGERGFFARTMEGLAASYAKPKTVMIDAT